MARRRAQSCGCSPAPALRRYADAAPRGAPALRRSADQTTVRARWYFAEGNALIGGTAHLFLNGIGLEGNAGNRIQSAEAWAFHVFDHIEWNDWTLTPGLRFESAAIDVGFAAQTTLIVSARRSPSRWCC